MVHITVVETDPTAAELDEFLDPGKHLGVLPFLLLLSLQFRRLIGILVFGIRNILAKAECRELFLPPFSYLPPHLLILVVREVEER